MITSFIAMTGVPSLVMGIPIPEDQTVTKIAVEDGDGIRQEASRARRRWRAVDVDDGDRGVVDDDVDPLSFGFVIDGSVDVDVERSEGDGVVNQDGHTTANATTWTISTDDCVAWDRGVFGPGGQFGLLKAGHFDIVCVKVRREFLLFAADAITIPLQKCIRGRRRRRSGSRVRMDGSAEKKDDDEFPDEDVREFEK